MDFTKFVALLESGALFFPRADKLGDPFEGSYSRGNESLRPEKYKKMYDEVEPELIRQINENKATFAKWHRQWTFISCWHMNPAESAAMWQLYANSNEAVAIRSSFYRLANALDEFTFIGTVEYIDFEKDWIPETNTFYPYVHKRLSFSHERELRAVYVELPTNENGIDMNAVPPDVGIEKPVNLNQLIESVYVAPTSPVWFERLVKNVCHRYSLETNVHKSALDNEPFY